MPTPATMKRYEQQQISIEVPLDVFRVQFGYRDRDSIQIRLEKDGTVYIRDDRETRKFDESRMRSGRVSWELFAEEWPDFVRYLLAKQHAAAEAAEGE
jgi:hypothetical protein